MGWLLELLFEGIKEMCSQFIIDMMDVAKMCIRDRYNRDNTGNPYFTRVSGACPYFSLTVEIRERKDYEYRVWEYFKQRMYARRY